MQSWSRQDGDASVVITSLLQSIGHVRQDMLGLATRQLRYADDKQKDYGEDHGVLYESLALLAFAILIDFSRQDVFSSQSSAVSRIQGRADEDHNSHPRQDLPRSWEGLEGWADLQAVWGRMRLLSLRLAKEDVHCLN